MDSQIWLEANGDDYVDFLAECDADALANSDSFYEEIQSEQDEQNEDAILEQNYEDFASQYDDDPNPYLGTYSED